MMLRYLLSFVLFIGLCSTVQAQGTPLLSDRFDFDSHLPYDKAIVTPTDFLGYEWGEQFTIYEKTVQYCQLLAEQSPRVVYHEYGETYEGRTLINLIISSEANIANLSVLQERHLSLLDPAVDDAEKATIVNNDPVFTSFSYNIHGNEASSTETAMQVAYRLGAAQDEATQDILDNSVIILYMCINPDGRDRYVYWANGVGRHLPGINPNDLEHYAPWPNGRTNHYWFDLNRDWIWGVHPESRGHTAEYQQWMPQVHVDYHEQGYNANYFTAPGATPRNLLLPDTYEAWSDTFGQANIQAFNAQDIAYFTRERFDFFYPGYGSSYPSVMGAIGMLTEQGGIAAGRAITTEDGYILTFQQRIYDHYLTSMATLAEAAAQRQALLNYSLQAWKPANSKSYNQTYIIKQEEGGFIHDFLGVMLRNNIEVQQATEAFSVPNCLNYRNGKTSIERFEAGDYLVKGDQARHLFIHSLLARQMAIEDSVMYDMATWSAPMAYNLEAYSSRDRIQVATQKISAKAATWSGEFTKTENAYAYVIDWQQRWAPRALSMLWAKGYRVRSALHEIANASHAFNAGSLIVLVGQNLEKQTTLAADLAEIAATAQVDIVALSSGRMLEGLDLASPQHRPVKQPRVAMLVEPPFSTYTSGQVYFLFDQETWLPIDRIRTSSFAQTALPRFGQRYGYTDINDYDVLILPGGGRHLERLFWQDQRMEISQWLQRGGTIIALEEAAMYFTEDGKITKLKASKPEQDTTEAAKIISYADQERYRGLQRIPGSSLRGHIDVTHPLAFGVKKETYALKLSTNALIPAAELQSVGRYHENSGELLQAGYASSANLDRLAGKTFAGVLPFGQGRIVYLPDNPHYRMFWRGTSRMVQNAAMLLPGFN